MTKKTDITNTLDDLAIAYRWIDHPAVFTVAESMQHIEDKIPIKNLLLQEKGTDRSILIIMAGNARLDMKRVEAQLGLHKLRFADAYTLKSTLGVTPGAVSVFGLLYDGAKDIEVVIDENLLTETELGFHPNDNTATIFIPSSALEKILKHTGHTYQVLKLYK